MYHAQWQQIGQMHSGIMLIPKHLRGEGQISFVVKELLVYHALITAGVGSVQDDIANQLLYL